MRQVRVLLKVRLLAQHHDELILEVDTRRCSLQSAAALLQGIMEGVAQLSVPLTVNLKVGKTWGSLQALQRCSGEAMSH